jgi:drug/metabolite transporter (DMT)-like permease
MTASNSGKPGRNRFAWAAAALAGLAGLKYGYDFGTQVAGLWLGILMALNGAVFCSLVAGALVERVLRPRPAPPGE